MTHFAFSHDHGHYCLGVDRHWYQMRWIWGKIPIIRHHIQYEKKQRTRYDVTKNVYVTVIRHLVVNMCILIDNDADLDANRAKVAAAMNNLIYTWKLPVYCCMMTSPILSMWHHAVTVSIHVRLLTNELRDSSESKMHSFTIKILVSLINWL